MIPVDCPDYRPDSRMPFGTPEKRNAYREAVRNHDWVRLDAMSIRTDARRFLKEEANPNLQRSKATGKVGVRLTEEWRVPFIKGIDQRLEFLAKGQELARAQGYEEVYSERTGSLTVWEVPLPCTSGGHFDVVFNQKGTEVYWFGHLPGYESLYRSRYHAISFDARGHVVDISPSILHDHMGVARGEAGLTNYVQSLSKMMESYVAEHLDSFSRVAEARIGREIKALQVARKALAAGVLEMKMPPWLHAEISRLYRSEKKSQPLASNCGMVSHIAFNRSALHIRTRSGYEFKIKGEATLLDHGRSEAFWPEPDDWAAIGEARHDQIQKVGLASNGSFEIEFGSGVRVVAEGLEIVAKPADPKADAWAKTVERMALGFEAMATHIRPVSDGELDGFEFWISSSQIEGRRRLTSGPAEQLGFRLLTAEGGSLKMVRLPWTAPGSSDAVKRDQSSFLGTALRMAGLLEDKFPKRTLEREYIRTTLSRLDGDALSLLKAVRSYDTPAYNIARSLPADAPFRAAVEKSPMLGAILTHRAHAEMNGGAYLNDPTLSDDPIGAFAQQAADFAGHKWPGLEFDTRRARAVIEAIGNVVVLYDLGLLPWHVAFLTYAPDAALPKTPEQMKAAMGFIEAATFIFDEGFIAPGDFYRELSENGNDWGIYDENGQSALWVKSLPNEIGNCVASQFLSENGIEPEADHNEDWGVGREIYASIGAGKGFLEALELRNKWDDDLDAAIPDRYSVLREKLLPEWAAELEVTALLARYGFSRDDGRDGPGFVRPGVEQASRSPGW
ncbi:hypothetical protein [Bosea sp. ANAM02]|uniref:hypothetical protein n=1 Tax=Bosea sp. ANAM02 TaxID=2020412 RepID=UPI00140ECEE5|nr:hypothetical protein [Bosea sp. ANAM02]BCB21959.1 hypothetical protein OCUBac02_48530 [Bosea sp. ANAM02]